MTAVHRQDAVQQERHCSNARFRGVAQISGAGCAYQRLARGQAEDCRQDAGTAGLHARHKVCELVPSPLDGRLCVPHAELGSKTTIMCRM